MPNPTSDPLTQLAFSVYENKGIYALLLGSGLSRAAEIPTGWEITLDLVRRVAMAQGVDDQPDWAAWYREETGEDPNYSTLIGELGLSGDERRSILHSYIEPTDQDREEERKIPTRAHHAIAELVEAGFIKVIVTTNFDRLMENALRERGIEPTVVASVDALNGAEPLTHTSCYILKLHGDYKDARILNTDEELSGYPDEYNVLLDRILDEYGLIICGWSGEWDHALRAAILRAPARRYTHYWMVRGKAGTGAQELINHRQARVIAARDADSFFGDLVERVQTLEKTHRQNPLGVELLVSTVKRYLAKPEHRIQLEELVTNETARLLGLLDDPAFSPDGGFSAEGLTQRVTRYQAATEPLARIAGVLGRWGDGSEFDHVMDAITAIWRETSQVASGLQWWLAIRAYPAVLAMTAYGLGLTRSGRWDELHRMFSFEVRAQHGGDTQRIVELLFLWAWEGGATKEIWQNLEGLDRHKTPLSDHLFLLFQEWGRSFLGLAAGYELMFQKFEFLGAMAYTETYEADALAEAARDNTGQGFLWVPVGRSGWDVRTREDVVADILKPDTRAALLSAGFGKGDAEFLGHSITNFGKLGNRFRF
ncbi:MAG: SIR2 family protein [Pseudomonadales bacterium]